MEVREEVLLLMAVGGNGGDSGYEMVFEDKGGEQKGGRGGGWR